MLEQDLTRFSNIQVIGWGKCVKDNWELMSLRALKAGLCLYLKRHTEDSGIDVWTSDPGGGGGGPGYEGDYANYLRPYARVTKAGLPEAEGATHDKVAKALRKECRKLIKEVLKTL